MTAETFQFTVPELPDRLLSSNAGARSRRDPWSVANATGRLKNDTMEALKNIPDLPRFARASATVTLMRSKRRPKLEQCPRCLIAAIADRKISACRCYRPKDIGNIGGGPLKPILDGLVWMELLPDDDYEHLTAVTLLIEIVPGIEDEGVTVTLDGFLL